MSLRVLGCSGAIAAGCRTTAFLLDEQILIDAGTGVGDLPLEALVAIDHVLLSHSHLDHVLGIPLLADAVLRRRRDAGRGPIQVHGLPETLEALRRHLFNGVIWPDFTCLPSPDQPVLRLFAFEEGQRMVVGGRQIEILPAFHTVPACGFAIRARSADSWTVYTGDTGPNPALWQRLKDLPLRQLIIEAAFGDDECDLAQRSRHHCPRSLARELEPLAADTPVWLTHAKPGEAELVETQLHRHAPRALPRPLQIGQVLDLG